MSTDGQEIQGATPPPSEANPTTADTKPNRGSDFLRRLGIRREKPSVAPTEPAQDLATKPDETEADKTSRLAGVRNALGKTGETIKIGAEAVREKAGEAIEVARELPNDPRVRQAAEAVKKLPEQARQVVRELPQRAEDLLEKTREERLATEALNKKRNPLQKMFSTWVGKITKTGIEMIPSPIGYGPGDVLSAANALGGKDLLSGEHLDKTDRIFHLIAAAIPLVPATPLVEIARLIRHRGEDAVHAKKQGQHLESVKHAKGAWQGLKALGAIIRPPKK